MKILSCTIAVLLLFISFAGGAAAEEIKLRSIGGVYTVPVKLNNSLTMDFMIDTGAADVGLSDELTGRLVSSGVMAERDFKGQEKFILADGSSVTCRSLLLRTVRIGGREVADVKGSSCPGKPPLLLGQSFLRKLGPWALDYGRESLVVMSEIKKAVEPPSYTQKDIEWQESAASQGEAAAQFTLARIFWEGDGVPRSEAKAIELVEKSAAQGYAPAQTALGTFYESGHLRPKNAAKAAELFRKASDQGLPKAMMSLANMYRGGEGVSKNIGLALELYRKAADRGDDIAHVNLGLMYSLGDGVSKDAATAADWYRRGADKGGLLSEYYLGMEFLKGEGVSKDAARGLGLVRGAAEKGLGVAQKNLCSLYFLGTDDVPQDKASGYAWCLVGAAGQAPLPGAETGREKADMEFMEKQLTAAELAKAKKLASNWKPGQPLGKK